MRTVVALAHLFASASASLENDSLSLLQTAAEVKIHNHIAAKTSWEPGQGDVTPKCGEGPGEDQYGGDAKGWIGGDGYQVGEVRIGNVDNKEKCIEAALTDPRCLGHEDEIDEFNEKEPGHIHSISATYAPKGSYGICWCEWGVAENSKDPGYASGWITCLAKGGSKPKKEKPAACTSARADFKDKKKALKDMKAALKAARAAYKASKEAKSAAKAAVSDGCPKKKPKEEPAPEGPISGEIASEWNTYSAQFAAKNVLDPTWQGGSHNNGQTWLTNQCGAGGFSLKLQAPTKVKEFHLLNTCNTPYNDRSTNGFTISLSMDGQSWTEALKGNLQRCTPIKGDPQVIANPNVMKAAFVKFEMTQCYGASGGLNYFQAFR